jgi:hypothetical protein
METEELDDFGKFEESVHSLVMILVIRRAQEMLKHRDSVSEGDLIDNYISIYAVRQAMWKAVEDGMFFAFDEGEMTSWIPTMV